MVGIDGVSREDLVNGLYEQAEHFHAHTPPSDLEVVPSVLGNLGLSAGFVDREHQPWLLVNLSALYVSRSPHILGMFAARAVSAPLIRAARADLADATELDIVHTPLPALDIAAWTAALQAADTEQNRTLLTPNEVGYVVNRLFGIATP